MVATTRRTVNRASTSSTITKNQASSNHPRATTRAGSTKLVNTTTIMPIVEAFTTLAYSCVPRSVFWGS